MSSQSPQSDNSESKSFACAICEQRAFGYNYEVVSCNACKMFFRRIQKNALDEQCRFDGVCFEGDDVKERRPKCRACRYKKCMTVGMTRSQTDPVGRSRSDSSSDSDIHITSSSPQSTSHNPPPNNSEIVKVTKSIVTQDHVNSTFLNNFQHLHSVRFDVYRVINVLEDPSFGEMVVGKSKLGVFARPLDIPWDRTDRKLKPWCSMGIMLVVEVIKTLDAYQELLLNDRVTLLKNVALKSHHLCIAFDSFHRNKGRVLNPLDGEIFPDSVYAIPITKAVCLEFLTDPVGPMIALKLTENEFFLINMIVICNPGIAGLSPSGQETLGRHQRYYSKVLLHLCLTTHGKDGPSRFGKIVALNEMLNKQTRDTLYVDKILRKYWCSSYYFPKVLQESCRVVFTGTGLRRAV